MYTLYRGDLTLYNKKRYVWSCTPLPPYPTVFFCITLKTAARHRNGARYLKASYLKTAKYISTSCLCDQCDDLYVDGMVAP